MSWGIIEYTLVVASMSTCGVLLVVKHPFSGAACLGLLSMISCFLIGVWGGSWIASIIFLVVYGGLVVAFGYMVALTPNPVFKVDFRWGVMSVGLGVFLGRLFPEVVSGALGLESLKMVREVVPIHWIQGAFLVLVVVVMLVTMYSVSAICQTGKGALRSKVKSK